MEKTLEKKLLTLGYLVINKKMEGTTSNEDISVLLKSFADLDFILDYSSIELLKNTHLSEVQAFYFHAFDLLKESKGAKVKHIYFYRNFPNMDHISDDEYILRAMLHYMTATEEEYGYMAQDIKTLKKTKEKITAHPITLKVIEEKDAISLLGKYFTALLEGNHTISHQDGNIMKVFLKEYPELVTPTTFAFKENLVLYARMILEDKKKVSALFDYLSINHFKEITDVLRLYAAISGYCSLLGVITFKSLDRKARKNFLSYLNALVQDKKDAMDDFALHEDLWKKAFRMLHVGEFKGKYPFIYDCAYRLRTNQYGTFFSKVNVGIQSGDKEVFTLLKRKPGYFARMLDSLLRNSSFSVEEILSQFSFVMSSIATPVIIQLWGYYQNRNHLFQKRFISYRSYSHFVSLETQETRSCYDEETLKKIIHCLEEGLKVRFKDLPVLNNVYLDPTMKNYMVPLNNKNQSEGINTLGFGSKIALDAGDNKVLRFFTYWKNIKNSRVDVDLSAEIYDENFEYVASLAWHDMGAGRKFKSYHSGDITTAPKGASEFIDINLEKAKEYCRYIVVCNTVFTGQTFNEISECFSGVMFRNQSGKRGPVFDPKTVRTKFDLTADSTLIVAFIIDLETMELIWCDIPQSGYYVAQESTIGAIIKRATGRHMSLYDLVLLHQNHITFVDDKEKAEIVIDDTTDSILHPSRVDEIMNWIP